MIFKTLLAAFMIIIWDQPSPADCPIVYDGIDLKSKLYRKEIAPAYWFSYTPSVLKNELKTQHLIETEAQLSQLESDKYLNLNIQVYSKKAVDEYGLIEPQAQLVLTTITNKKIKLLSRSKSQAVFSTDLNKYIYPVSYTLDKGAIKKLANDEIDKVGIQWSSGYEEYIVYEVDFLMNQIACLNQ